jgi:prepilin-type N-terminal cleavage/methylation domain-containing protein
MMPTKNQHRKILPGRKGFTLVEMMIVIVIIGVLSSVSVPPMFRYVASRRLQSNTDRMTSDMQYARSVAVTNAKIITFSATESGYTLSDALSGDVLRNVQFDEGVAMEADNSVNFFPWGMADDGVFTLSSGSGSYKISLLPTGVVEVALQ